jgi:protein arginine kinase
MSLPDLTQRTPGWLKAGGPAQEVVISSRVRLARNLAGMPFLDHCTPSHQAELQLRLSRHVLETDMFADGFYMDLATADAIDRQLLVERHSISRHHADSATSRGVAIAADEAAAVMINEEDHVRMQVLRNGLQLEEATEQINRLDDLLEQQLDWAFHSRYGYLTACPSNVGTGMRISVMLHLPALRLTGELDKAIQAARDMHLAVRGLYGEGTTAAGDFFQLSNQTTLGRTEQELVEELAHTVVPDFITYEMQARDALASGPDRRGVEDRVFRAVAVLRAARRIGSDEMVFLLSMVRLGVHLGWLPEVPLAAVNDLFMFAQPAHLQRLLNRTMTPVQRAEARAQFIQQRLATA